MNRYPSFLVHRQIPMILRGDRVQSAAQFLTGATSTQLLEPPVCRSPIFVLSAGWRSGSTLLQRLMCSGPDVLLWGEPFEEFVPVHRMAASIEMLDADSPHLKFTPEHIEGSLADNWIANLNPGLQPLLCAHRAYFESLFAVPARDRGFRRWGAKYVRLSAQHAHYLKWLYPEAKFVLLVRHPMDAYRSYKRLTWWYTVRPEFRVDSGSKFMSHWAYLANSFLDEASHLGALLVRYEDLKPGNPVLKRIEEFLETPINPAVLEKKIGSKASRFRITLGEKLACRWITGQLCRELNYPADSGSIQTASA
ncbi:MAG: sulfotransferase [Planctomycetaceae bacterium]|nr:MAG: sulfotransferase [Planctomycetaceae bacterium]